jgi:hypothetical protein
MVNTLTGLLEGRHLSRSSKVEPARFTIEVTRSEASQAMVNDMKPPLE